MRWITLSYLLWMDIIKILIRIEIKWKISHLNQSLDKRGVSMNDKKLFRSLIKKYFPVDLLVKLDEITMSHDIDNNSKTKEIVELLKEYNVPYSPLGNGTNRYGILIDGYAVKIALDRMGKTDNKREFKYTKVLYPSVVKVYECLETGLIAVTEYVTIFSLDDFYENQSKMREILAEISSVFLVGDIGISTNNYVNWGTRNDGSICILDFAYIYSLSYKGFKCTCEDEGTLEFDKDFNYLICPFCKKKWDFASIRRRISKEDEIKEIGDIMTIGYVLRDSEEELEVDPEKTPISKKEKKKIAEREKRKERLAQKSDEEAFDYDLSVEDQIKMMRR